MAVPQVERVALMSIHPRFANAIVDGVKGVEFRKRKLASDISRVLIYATFPVQRVIGEFTVAEIVEGPPEVILSKFVHAGGIGEVDFRRYYANSRSAVAIVVGAPRRFAAGVRLAELTVGATPAIPQSFSYLPAESLAGAGIRA